MNILQKFKLRKIIKEEQAKEKAKNEPLKEKLKKPINKKHSKPKRTNQAILKEYLMKAGFENVDEKRFSKNIKIIAIVLCGILSIVLIALMFLFTGGIIRTIIYLAALWTAVFAFLLIIIWIIVYTFLDFRIYERTKQLEEVLPDFLQLTSANISAGMPIDRALWFAVRPGFGVLAKEIEEVAKSTIAGDDLESALMDLSKKYDSTMLKRSVSLIIEGMRAGGKLADLLSKIALDIQETKLMRKEISASIMTYVIFITFASIIAAPFLFALSTQLLQIIQTIMGSIDLGSASSSSVKIQLSGDSISIKDFQIFSSLTLAVTAMFSAMIVSAIQNGNVRDGLSYIPVYIAVSLVLYAIANALLGSLLGTFI